MDTIDDERWETIVRREAGDFFLGVLTTGVFCRPGCPARTPLRRNVRLFGTAQGAAAAGYRPCLKCRPLGRDPLVETAVTAARAIEANPEEQWNGEQLASVTGVGARTTRTRFEAALGLSPRAFRDAVRLRRYKEALRVGEGATVAGFTAGYGSEAARHEGTKGLAMNATAYASGGKGERIEWCALQTALGEMVLATSEKGVCLLQFIEGEPASVRVRREYPAAIVEEALPDSPIRSWAGMVAGFVGGTAPRPDLPIDLRGTAFQMRVWQALRSIQPGETPTYGEIAARIGTPKAYRAVGTANGKNPVAVVVPCHLVIASGGKLGGYAGGLDRKKHLIAMEAAANTRTD